MSLDLSILYRGSLSSCNYDCHYCPFAKHRETQEELSKDRQQLERFVDWTDTRNKNRLSVLFTPWGEALTRRWYRNALVYLSGRPNIHKVAIQTNLACSLEWLDDCDRNSLGLWCTWHPTQISRSDFLKKCRQLDDLKVQYSVGIVGLREYFADLELLRNELADDTYLWVNAYKDVPDYYSEDEVQRLTHIDPLFPVNNVRHPSLNQACNAGESVVSIDGDGNVRRCHFIKTVLGNIYQDDIVDLLAPRPCTNSTCGCHIGYIHMPQMNMRKTFGDGLLARIPDEPIWRTTATNGKAPSSDG